MGKKIIYNVILILFIIGLFFVCWALIYYLMVQKFLPNWVFPSNELSVELWIQVFIKWYNIFLIVIFAFVILWYIVGIFINYPPVKYARAYWYIFFLIVIVFSLAWPAILLWKAPLVEGVLKIFLIFSISGICLFYFSTLLLSPVSFKYACPLASLVRKW